MEDTKIANRQSRSNESNANSKRQANSRQVNVGVNGKSQNVRSGNDSKEREPQIVDTGIGGSTLDDNRAITSNKLPS